jgi:hypothetical protein
MRWNLTALHRIALSFLLSALLAAAAGALEVEVEFFGSIDLSKFTTYAWKDGVPAPNYLVEKAIREEVAKQLAAKGLRKVESEAPCHVRTSVAKDQVFPAGILQVEVLEASTGRLAWRGTALGVVTAESTKKRQKIAARAVKQMFKRYPKLEQ